MSLGRKGRAQLLHPLEMSPGDSEKALPLPLFPRPRAALGSPHTEGYSLLPRVCEGRNLEKRKKPHC